MVGANLSIKIINRYANSLASGENGIMSITVHFNADQLRLVFKEKLDAY